METLNNLTFKVGEGQPKPALAKLRNILNCTDFCTLCYEVYDDLNELDDVPLLDYLGIDSVLSLRDMLKEIFGNMASKIVFSNYVCRACNFNIISAFKFVHKTIQIAHIYENYITQLESESIDLLNCMKDHTCANAVIVLEEHVPNKNNVVSGITWKSNIAQKKDNFHYIPSQRTYVKDIPMKFVCEDCKSEFSDKKFLIYHLDNNLCVKKKRMEVITLKSKNIKNSDSDTEKKQSVKCPECQFRPCDHEKFIENFLDQKKMKCKDYKCLECNFTCKTLKQLIGHVNSKHMDCLSDICELCGKIFYLREQYFSHFHTFHKDHKICPHCNCIIPIFEIKSHKTECQTSQKTISCDQCPSTFDSELKATLHTMRHEERQQESNKPKGKLKLKRCYSCPVCDVKFDGKIKLQKHVLGVHNAESYRTNKCQFCDVQFGSKKEYLSHVQEAEHMSNLFPNQLYRYKCEYCDYRAKANFVLVTHMNRYHLKVMPYQCDICKNKFLDKRKLKAHIDRHLGKFKRVCDICGDTLGSTTALIKHKRLHTGERPYPCHLCDVSLNSASERKFHIMRKHTKKSVPCPICDSKFHTAYFVRRHIQTVHWKSNEKFDYKKVVGLQPEHYDLFRDKRLVVL